MPPVIDLFDDPINPHGWTLEPAVRRLRVEFPDAEWRVRPVVLVPSWETFEGPEIDGGRGGMAAACAQLSERSGMPIDEFVWFQNPPTSSTDACRAVAAAASQGTAMAALRALREATFLKQVDVSDRDELYRVLSSVAGLDAEAALAAVEDGSADEALDRHRRAAVEAADARRVDDRCELPTVVVSGANGAAGFSGRQPYETYRDGVVAATELAPTGDRPDLQAAIERFSPEGWVSAAELSAVLGDAASDVRDRAQELVAEDALDEREFAAESLWRIPQDP